MHNRINPFRVGTTASSPSISDAPVMPQPLTFEFACQCRVPLEGCSAVKAPSAHPTSNRSGHDPHGPDPASTLSIGAMSC